MLSFAQPLFLLALGGLVVPFLIHRISRARPVAWKFPSIERIRKTPLPRQGKRAISDWLLLILRTLILALFIIALAGPIWTPKDDQSVSLNAASTSGAILLDYSSSMSGWDAMEETSLVLQELDQIPDVQWSWLVADSAIVARYPTGQGAAIDSPISTLLQLIDDTSPSRDTINPRKALLGALEVLETAPAPHRLHVISDFQDSSWGNQLPEIPDHIDLHLHRVGKQDRDQNLGLRDVLVVPLDGERLRVIAHSINFGSKPATTTVQLQTLDEFRTQETTLEPGIPVPVVFEINRPAGSPDASIELIPADPDPYPRDNRMEFDAAAPEALEVLALNPSTAISEEAEETFFLEQALDTGSSTEWLRYSLLNVGLFAINPETLSRTTAVFVPSSAFGNPSIPWDVLSDYIHSGGLVVATMGEDAVRGIQGLRAAGYPVGDYNGIAGRSGSERFYVGPIPGSSPLSSVFEGDAQRDLALMSVRRFARLRLGEEGNVLLQSEDNEPLLVSIPSGNGALVLSAFPWDRSASDFPLRPSFLPIVREVFALANPNPTNIPGIGEQASIPVTESVTTTINPEDIRQRLTGSRDASEPGVSPDLQRQGALVNSHSFAPWLLLTAILFLVAESVLARRLIVTS